MLLDVEVAWRLRLLPTPLDALNRPKFWARQMSKESCFAISRNRESLNGPIDCSLVLGISVRGRTKFLASSALMSLEARLYRSDRMGTEE